jgi:3-oxoacyl-[acyl-carrier-protein] synthase-1
MVTGVGFNAPASCAAIRAGITGFVETGFMFAGEWLLGCPVPYDDQLRGRETLLRMGASVIAECLSGYEHLDPATIPVLLCLAEEDRSGRLDRLDESLLTDIQTNLDKTFHPASTVIADGRIAGVQAIQYAQQLMAKGCPYCIVAGVDSILSAQTLTAYDEQDRLATEDNSDGFIPGEAGAAVLLGPPTKDGGQNLIYLGAGFGLEEATVNSDQPLRGDGMVAAFKAALADAGVALGDLDYRITDLSGEQYGFKEATLALDRLLRERKEEFDIWHPGDCIGEVGAAAGVCVMAVALAAAQKGYAPGDGVLCHLAGDGRERAAMIMRSQNGGTS